MGEEYGFILDVVSGGSGSFSLHDGLYRIGRDSKADIQVSSMAAARLHAEISISGSHVQIRDLGARNGVLVNGRRIMEQELGPGDEITLGNVVLRMRQRTTRCTRKLLTKMLTKCRGMPGDGW